MSILDMATVGSRIENPGRKIPGIFVNPVTPETLLGSAFAEVDQSGHNPSDYAGAAQKAYKRLLQEMKKNLSRSELADFERLGKNKRRFEEQAKLMGAPKKRNPSRKKNRSSSSKKSNPKPKTGRTTMERRTNPHKEPGTTLSLKGFAPLAKGRKQSKLDTFVNEAQKLFKKYIKDNREVLTQEGLLDAYNKLARSKAQIRDRAVRYASKKEGFKLTGVDKKLKNKALGVKKPKKVPASYSKAADLTGSGKNGRILMRDIIRAAVDGDLTKSTIRALCSATPELAKYVDDADLYTKIDIERYRVGKMPFKRAKKLGLVLTDGRLKVDAERARKARATRKKKAQEAGTVETKTETKPAKKKKATKAKKKEQVKAPASSSRKAPERLGPHGGKVVKTVKLRFQGTTDKGNKSDKVYRLDVVKVGSKYAVDYTSGKFDGPKKTGGKKGSYDSESEAVEAMNAVVKKKMKDGYAKTTVKIDRGTSILESKSEETKPSPKKKSTSKKKQQSKAPSTESKASSSTAKSRAQSWRKGRNKRLAEMYKARQKTPTLTELKAELTEYGIPAMNVSDKDISSFMSLGITDTTRLKKKLRELNGVDNEKFRRLANYAFQGGLLGKLDIPKPIGRFENPSRQHNPADYAEGGIFRGLSDDITSADSVFGKVMKLAMQGLAMGAGFVTSKVYTKAVSSTFGHMGAGSETGKKAVEAGYSLVALFLNSGISAALQDTEFGARFGGAYVLGSAVSVARNGLRLLPSNMIGVSTLNKVYALDGYCGCQDVSGYENFVPSLGAYRYDDAVAMLGASGNFVDDGLPGQFAPATGNDVSGFEVWNEAMGRYEVWNEAMGRYEVWNEAMGRYEPAIEAHQLQGYEEWNPQLGNYDPAIMHHQLGNYDPAITHHQLGNYDPAIQPELPVFDGDARYVPTQDIFYPTGYTRQ